MSSESCSAGVPSPSKATLRDWVGLGVITLPCLLYAMDVTVLNVAVPRISLELQPTSTQLLWIVDIYTFLLAALLITMGALGDRIGRRRLLLIGAAGFGIASLIAAFSNSTTMLIAARALLGIAGATLAPSTLSLIRHMFLDSHQRALAIGVWTVSHSVGAALGPLIGGALLEHFHWGSVFMIGVPVMLLLLALGPVLLPEFRDPSKSRMDLISAGQSLIAILLITYGIKQIAVHGWQSLAVTSVVVGAMMAVAFVRRQLRSDNPLIDLRLLRASEFTAALTAFTLGCFVVSAILLLGAIYLQLGLGFSAFEAGLWMLPLTVGHLIGSMLTPAFARRVSAIAAIAYGLLVGAVGLVMIAAMEQVSRVEILAGGLFVLSVGLAPVYITAINLMVGTVPPERAGEAASISETGSEFGAAMGVAIMGSIANFAYRLALESAIPIGVPLDSAQAALQTLAGAIAMAQQLPVHLGVPLLEGARAAFEESLHVVAALSAGVVVAIAVGLLVLARSRPSKTVDVYRSTRLDDAVGEGGKPSASVQGGADQRTI